MTIEVCLALYRVFIAFILGRLVYIFLKFGLACDRKTKNYRIRGKFVIWWKERQKIFLVLLVFSFVKRKHAFQII